ncbi:hypothetical protein ES704_03021 [subsurface metagenome]|jgi:hypothetical protein
MAWRLPTSHNAKESQWHNPTNCYDGNPTTYGYDKVYPWPFAGYYIEFNIAEIQCNKIRFNARSVSGDVDKIDIDIYYNNSWHNVFYKGYFSSKVWVEVNLGGTYAVTKARVRFFNSDVFLLREGWLYEFNFFEIVVGPSGWINEPYAYDDNTGTAASCFTPARSWTPWLIREFSKSLYSCAVKFYARYEGTSGINSIDIDVYYHGSWHDVFQGSFLNQVWIEKTNELDPAQDVTKIRVRFYNNSSDPTTAYIEEIKLVQAVSIPKVTTHAATNVEDDKATLNGEITDTGSTPYYGVNCTTRGFKYKEGIDGDEQDIFESDDEWNIGTFSQDLTDLDPTKKYYFKAYAINEAGIGEGEWKSFGVVVELPKVDTNAATGVTHEKAVLNGEITETGGQDPGERGFEYKIGEESTILTIRETGEFGIGAYSLDFDGLDPNLAYHFRAYAKNDVGTGYGPWLDFGTGYTDPMVITHNATNELTTQVTGNGEIVRTGGMDCGERGFEYGLTKTPTWVKKETEGGYGVGHFNLTIDGLTANTEYWYRAYAVFYAYSKVIPDIDIGSAAINRSNWRDYGVSLIVKENPANASGRITSVDVWFKDGTSGAWVATFYETDPNRFTARDRQWIGPIALGVKETFEVDLKVEEGDYIGIFFGLEGQIEADTEGEGIWSRVGDIYTWEDEEFTFTPDITISLGAIGFTPTKYIGYGEWVKFVTAAPGAPGDRPSGYKNDVCSDDSGFTYILNRSFTDDGATYKSFFVLSTDLSGKKTLHTNKRLLDIFSYFDNKGMGTAKVYVKRNNEPVWQEAGEISLTGEEETIIKHLPVDFLAKTYLIKFVFWNNFEFVGMITEAVPIGDRP